MFVPSLSWQNVRFLSINGSKMPLFAGMPVSRRGVYVLDDTNTARLSGGDSSTIAWWELPKTAAGPPPPPPPAPPPKDTCAKPQPATDCAPNEARVKTSLDNTVQKAAPLLSHFYTYPKR
jgi:hypothetical protein